MDERTSAFFSRDAISSVPWLLIGKVLTFFLYFGISILIVRGLGPHDYGIYALLTSIAEYLAVVCAVGLNTSLLRFVPELVQGNNRAGLKRLLWRSLMVQVAALVSAAVGMWFLSTPLSGLFHIAFVSYIAVLMFFTAMLVTKEYLNNLFTSLFLARFLAFTSVGQAILFCVGLLWLGYTHHYTVTAVLLLYSLSIGSMALASLVKLRQFLHRWPEPKMQPGIGRQRVLWLTLPTMFNAVTNKLLQQYSEIFFLGYFVSASMVGYYALGFSLANLLLTFVPMALHTLFTSAFAEAYSRHPGSIGVLTSAVYQVLIVVTVPLSFFGFVYSPAIVQTFYGEAMAGAGPVAAFFCLFQILPMIWIPLSMAITATEQVAHTTWLNGMQLVVNLVLDYFLIKHFAIEGAFAAILLTFIITLPVKLYVIRRLIGGIYFPISFFSRIAIPAALLAAICYLVFPQPRLLGLCLMAVVYGVGFFVMLRVFKLVRPSDTERFHSIELPMLSRALHFLTGGPARG